MPKPVRNLATVGEPWQGCGSRKMGYKVERDRQTDRQTDTDTRDQARRWKDPKTHFAHFLLVSSRSGAAAQVSSDDDEMIGGDPPSTPLSRPCSVLPGEARGCCRAKSMLCPHAVLG